MSKLTNQCHHISPSSCLFAKANSSLDIFHPLRQNWFCLLVLNVNHSEESLKRFVGNTPGHKLPKMLYANAEDVRHHGAKRYHSHKCWTIPHQGTERVDQSSDACCGTGIYGSDSRYSFDRRIVLIFCTANRVQRVSKSRFSNEVKRRHVHPSVDIDFTVWFFAISYFWDDAFTCLKRKFILVKGRYAFGYAGTYISLTLRPISENTGICKMKLQLQWPIKPSPDEEHHSIPLQLKKTKRKRGVSFLPCLQPTKPPTSPKMGSNENGIENLWYAL